MHKLYPLRRGWPACLVALSLGIAQARAAEAPSSPPASPRPTVTDDQIVATMKRGADFLLSQKKGDNWETGKRYTLNGQFGGETCLTLLTLLQVGQSLQDDPVYGPRLHPNGPDLAPVVDWVSRLEAEETYTAALQACALTFVPRRQGPTTRPSDTPQAALQRAYRYLMAAMGVQGGYTYGPPGTGRGRAFDDLWSTYYRLKSTSRDTTAINNARRDLDNLVRNLRRSFGGPDFEIQRYIEDLREKARAGGRAGSAAQAEIAELGRYSASMPPAAPIDFQAALARDRQVYEDFVRRERSGDIAGLANVKVEDLPALLAEKKNLFERSQMEAASRFAPVGDLSNAQYGALGMWALADAGFEIRREYWLVTDRFWRLLQRPDGSWSYAADKSVRDPMTFPAMTVAGLATLFLTQEFTDKSLRSLPKPDKNIEAGLAWLNANFKPDTGNMYYMYGVERVGLATGLKYLGPHDWFREGAADIVRRQKRDGSWDGNFVDANSISSTCFAMLFLSRGRNPIVFNKLQYDGPWNARPQDDAFLTRHLARKFERPLNWQVVNLQVDPTAWLDAPILLITGSGDPRFTPEQIARLRTFIEAGGMIFSSADETNLEFTNAIRRIAPQAAGQKYEMRQLPRSHILFGRELGADLPVPPQVWGVSNGIRELWVHSPMDMGASWQAQRFTNRDHFEFPSALFFYATGKVNLQNRLASTEIPPSTAPVHTTRTLARLLHDANADPEPGAWPRLAARLRSAGVDLKIERVPIAELDIRNHRIAHLTGAGRVVLTAPQSASLKRFLDAGGILLADAAGGNPEFTDTFLRTLQGLYPGVGPVPLPKDHPVYQGKFAHGPARPITEARFRKYGILTLGKPVSEPALDGLSIGGKVRILFSQWDISSGLLGTNTWGIVGYAPDTAEQLATNMLLWAGEQPAP